MTEAELAEVCEVAGHRLGCQLHHLFMSDPDKAAAKAKAVAISAIEVDGWHIHFTATACDAENCWLCLQEAVCQALEESGDTHAESEAEEDETKEDGQGKAEGQA